MTKRISLTILLSLTVLIMMGRVTMKVMMPRGGSLGVGDKFQIEVVCTDTKGDLHMPGDVPGCNVLYNSNYSSSSYSSSGGKTTHTSKTVYTLTLQAKSEGNFTFGPVSVGGEKSNSVSYKIGSSGSSSKAQAANNSGGDPSKSAGEEPKFIGTGNGDLFMRASVSSTNAYEQEALVYTVKLYTSYDNLKFLGATESPKFEGFTITESDQISRSFVFETLNGRTYKTAVIARYIIFPQMTGTRTITGNTYKVSVDEREYYQDSYFGRMTVGRPLEFNVKPNDLKINVRPLPSPRPANFSGAVGQYKIRAELKTPKMRTNQPGEVVYIVSGSGNLKMVNPPALETLYPKEFEVYTPETDVKETPGVNDVTGTVTFDYSIMPLETGNFTLPKVSFVYFNPATGKYEESVAQGFNVEVAKGSGSSKSQSRNRLVFNPKLMESSGTLHKGNTPYVYTFWYWAAYIGNLLVLIIVVIIYRRYLKANADILQVRSRKAGRVATKRLRRAQKAMTANDRTLFYAELLKAMYGYLGDKLSIPASELNRENISDILKSRDVPENEVASLLSLVDEVEQSRYSPLETAVPMPQLYDKASTLINLFQQSLKIAK